MNNKGLVESSASLPEQKQGEITVTRFVSFLDIMGFKDLVARNEHRVILSKLTKLTDHISETVGQEEGFHFSMFSDSILIYSDDSNFDSFVTLVKFTSSIVNKSISIGLPIKGAIAKGMCTATTGAKLLYFGQPIIDAFKLEENLVIYGVAIHNTAEDEAIKLANDEDKALLYDYKVKLKSAASSHYIVNWYGIDVEGTISMLKGIRKSVSDAPRRYIDNTLECIEGSCNRK